MAKAKKCKKGFKNVNGTCVSQKTYKVFGKLSDEVKVVKLALIGAVSSVGGWAIFDGIVKLVGLEKVHPVINILVGLVIITLVYKFGLTKLK